MILLAEVSHAEEIHGTMMAAFEEYRSSNTPSSALEETPNTIRTALKNGEEKAFLFWKEKKVVGAVRFREQEELLYFFRLSVRPEERGRGIARQLLAALEVYAASRKLFKLQCQVRVSVTKNIALYTQNGFCLTDRKTVSKLNGTRVETAFMTKELNG
ncbi:Acetyltransferase (GNAT) domain-containing protein [Terribacillus aidingensis]|uniref:Acetyltransferase (GNAT) domain-containing protein n=1 Tax=Terribacillus aidingensis TaxID=586416 RepID=A0A285NDZ7_9BACI|nr:GNAT family N-acetyltransferase [Terribacillus aidingensis]SNZ05881.1 Acetyltransferase (GNAT) domain-containing protein [Terribacillus aidingensis]